MTRIELPAGHIRFTLAGELPNKEIAQRVAETMGAAIYEATNEQFAPVMIVDADKRGLFIDVALSKADVGGVIASLMAFVLETKEKAEEEAETRGGKADQLDN